MVIKEIAKDDLVPVESVKPGSVFKYGNEIYLRTNSSLNQIGGVIHLKTGYASSFIIEYKSRVKVFDSVELILS